MSPAHQPAPALTSRLIAASLIAGVTLFALVAWFMVQGGGPMADDAATAGVMVYAWAGVTLAALAAAVLLWRLRVAPLLERPRGAGRDDAAERHGALHNGLVLTWALVEGPALFGIIVYLLYGTILTYAAGLLLVWLGIGLTFPRSAWFA